MSQITPIIYRGNIVIAYNKDVKSYYYLINRKNR